VIDVLVGLHDVDLSEFICFFIKCVIQNSNYTEIVTTADYMEKMKIKIPELAVCRLLCLFVDYDDWVHFKKYFLIYFDAGLISDATIKKVISSLVEKQNLELMRLVIGITMKNGSCFLNLKLTENQYKFVIMSLVKSQIDLTSKLAEFNQIVVSPRTSNVPSEAISQIDSVTNESKTFDIQEKDKDTSFKDVSDDDSDCFEILSEEMIQKIIKEISHSEKKK
jgi:hypothetical protein